MTAGPRVPVLDGQGLNRLGCLGVYKAVGSLVSLGEGLGQVA